VAATKKVPVTMRAVIQRLNRHLAHRDEKLKAYRGERDRFNMGDYYIIDVSENVVLVKDVDPEQKAREAGVLKAWEKVAK
jgi:hypothetical protein